MYDTTKEPYNNPARCVEIIHNDLDSKRVPELEKVILTEAHCCFVYATQVIKTEEKEFEDMIKTVSSLAYWYAVDFLKKPWKPGEIEILKDTNLRHKYSQFCLDYKSGTLED